MNSEWDLLPPSACYGIGDISKVQTESLGFRLKTEGSVEPMRSVTRMSLVRQELDLIATCCLHVLQEVAEHGCRNTSATIRMGNHDGFDDRRWLTVIGEVWEQHR